MRKLTKRLILVEVMLIGLIVSKMMLASLGTKLNAERVKKSAERLEQIPEAIGGWEWDRTARVKDADVARVTGGGYDLLVRSYVKQGSGDRLYFQVARWLDPLNCYEVHGWQVVKVGRPLLHGEEGRILRAAGVKEGWVEKDAERMAVLFWESDLLEPAIVREGALTEDFGAKGRLSKLWGRMHRRIKSYFQKSDIVAKVIYVGELEDDETREAVVRFAREMHQVLPGILR